MYAGISKMLCDAFDLSQVRSLRLAGLWAPPQPRNSGENTNSGPGLENNVDTAVPMKELELAFEQLTTVKSLVISKDTSPQQIRCVLDTGASNGQGAVPSFPSLEELVIENICWWRNCKDFSAGPCGIPYNLILDIMKDRKTLGCSVQKLRIRDAQAGTLKNELAAPFQAAVPDLDIKQSCRCTCGQEV
ncbi:hypothetical protein NM688_g9226 [Phlebia brevispora]|uniref:Uncharacterized protein n=1 Tax=Phlebia brevispora TaxID=194682 RepID=A0ACC1RJX6_9APHY|nr:hypothetical protein NM688_g9226 [Phlebia brevispora]